MSNELLCPAEPFVYEFLDNVLTELADVFPAPYVHLGVMRLVSRLWVHGQIVLLVRH